MEFTARRHSMTFPYKRDFTIRATDRQDAERQVQDWNNIVLIDSEDWVELL